jgi:hypothetical protein
MTDLEGFFSAGVWFDFFGWTFISRHEAQR